MKWILIVWFGHGISGGSHITTVAYFDEQADCNIELTHMITAGRGDRLKGKCIKGYPVASVREQK